MRSIRLGRCFRNSFEAHFTPVSSKGVCHRSLPAGSRSCLSRPPRCVLAWISVTWHWKHKRKNSSPPSTAPGLHGSPRSMVQNQKGCISLQDHALALYAVAVPSYRGNSSLLAVHNLVEHDTNTVKQWNVRLGNNSLIYERVRSWYSSNFIRSTFLALRNPRSRGILIAPN